MSRKSVRAPPKDNKEDDDASTEIAVKRAARSEATSEGLARIFILPSIAVLLFRVYVGGTNSPQYGPYKTAAAQFAGRAHFSFLRVGDIRDKRWGPREYTGYLSSADAYGIIAHPVQGLDPFLENFDLRFLNLHLQYGLQNSVGSPSIQEIEQDNGSFTQVENIQ